MKRKEILKTINLSRFAAFDFETTGLDPMADRIIELAAIRFEDGEITDRFVTLVNPGQPISPMITRITGISDEMVRDKPKEEEFIEISLFDISMSERGSAFAIRFRGESAVSISGGVERDDS